MTFDNFLETAWNDHADRPQQVAERLTASITLVDRSEYIAPFARIVTHVYGEHLGQWSDGIALLEALRRVPAFDGTPAIDAAIVRGIATLRYASGERDALASLSAEDGVSVLATVASAFAGRQSLDQALMAFSDALRIAEAGFAPKSPAHRALAIGGNNLAATLEEKRDRNAAETDGMVIAAEAALRYWKVAGTWLEEERAEYRLTRSLLQAGRHDKAVESARRCIEVCERNGAPAFEQFFAHSALALTHRRTRDDAAFAVSLGRALEWLDKVPADERQWCENERNQLVANELEAG